MSSLEIRGFKIIFLLLRNYEIGVNECIFEVDTNKKKEKKKTSKIF